MTTRAHWFPWIIVCGVLGGIVEAVPLQGTASCCCFPFLLFAGAGSVIVIVQRARVRMPPVEGAIVGLVTGVFAGIVGGVLGALRELLSHSLPLLFPFLRGEQSLGAFLEPIWGGLVIAALYLLMALPLGAIGGAAAAAIVKPTAPPPPR